MFLKKVELNGFKSFAQKTHLILNKNVISIVGPNGCGKSNIVDALRWVLGEQKSSILRSDRMENVIFNGSENKKPLNVAEVSITLDNTNKLLPIDYSEVVITRRLYRSGESEYLLNNNVERLKDINNLIMDTGIGPNAYSIMELKMVESILSDKYEERLKIFEEAAGISKYKNQRNATFRKLDSTKADIMRVNDIITEIERTVANLKRQVRKVEQYEKLNKNFKQKKYMISHYEIATNEKELLEKKRQINRIDTELSKTSKDIAVLEANMESKKKELLDLEKILETKQKKLNQKLDALNKTENAININKERKNFLRNEIVRLKKEGSILHSRTENLKMRNSEISQLLETCIRELSTAKSEYQTAEYELNTFMENYSFKKDSINSVRNNLIDTIKKLSEKSRIRDRIKKELADKKTKEKSVFAEREKLKQLIKNKEKSLSELYGQKEKLTEQYTQLKQDIDTTTEEIDNLEDSLIAKKEEILNESSREERTRNQLEFLENLLRSRGELSEGEKYLLDNKKKLKGLYGTVGEIIDCDKKYRTAIENSLGNALNYLVFNDISSAKQAVNLLATTQKGKATVIPLDLIPSDTAETTQENLKNLTLLKNVIKTASEYEPMIRFLTAGIFLTDSLLIDNIAEFQDKKIVDLAGNIYFGNGIFKSGSPDTKKFSLIGRQNEIARAKEALEHCISRKKELSIEEGNIKSLLDQENIKLDEMQKQRDTLNGQLQKQDRDVSVLEFDIKKDKENLSSLESELKQLELFKIDSENIDELEKEIPLLEAERMKFEETLEEMKKTEITLEEERKVKENNRLEKKLNATKKEEELIRFEKEKQRYEEDLKETKSSIDKIETDFEKTKNTIAATDKELADFEKRISQLIGEKELKEQERDKISDQAEIRREEVTNLEKKLKELRNHKDDLNSQNYEIKLEASRIEEKISTYKKSLRKDGFLTGEKFKEETDINIEEEKAELEKLEEKIRNFGPVNYLAVDDYNLEKERLDFLIQQRTDLIDAEKSLLQTIEKINTTAQERFNTAFEKIRKNFVEIFTKFFENGEADLKIIPTDDPLEYRIDVISKPFGKKITSTALLSGGEKALTAIILLFAIYREKPSPFCILDEVDAPLDDENLSRFLKVLREFSQDTQFIIVTHNKMTMENSEFLYGITMEEPGISKAVAVDINRN